MYEIRAVIKLTFLIIFMFFYRLVGQTLPSVQSCDWTNVGIINGLPSNLTVYNVLSTIPPLINDGITDNSIALQSLINNTTSYPSPCVFMFPPGDYVINSEIEIRKNGRILRGSGLNTRIFCNSLTNCFDVNGFSESVYASVIGGYTQGSTEIVVDNPNLFVVGNYFEIYQANISAWMNTTNPIDWNTSSSAESVGQLAKILNVSTSTGTITIDRPLKISFSDDNGFGYIRAKSYDQFVENCGFENFYLEVTNPLMDGYNFRFRIATGCWILGVESNMTSRMHVKQDRALNNFIRGNYFHHSFVYGGGGQGYGVECGMHTTDCLIEDNVFDHLRHSMMVQNGANGNVFGYNCSTDPYWTTNSSIPPDISLHGHYPFMNLFESNIVQEATVSDYWGPCGPGNTLLRNRVGISDLTVDDNSHYTNIIGNEIVGSGSTIAISPGITNVIKHANNVNNVLSYDPAYATELAKSYYRLIYPIYYEDLNWPSIDPINDYSNGMIAAGYRCQNAVAKTSYYRNEYPYCKYELARWDFSSAGPDEMEVGSLSPEIMGSCMSISNIRGFNNLDNSRIGGSNPGVPAVGDGAICIANANNTAWQWPISTNKYFSFTASTIPGVSSYITGLSFYEQALPVAGNPLAVNNYPQLFGIAVLRNGILIYETHDIPTSQLDWAFHHFPLSDPLFTSDGSTNVQFDFVIQIYSPFDIGGSQSVWDIDEILICGGCCISPQPPILSVIDNQCPQEIGRFLITQPCSDNSYIEYSTDNGVSWVTTLPDWEEGVNLTARCTSLEFPDCSSINSNVVVGNHICCPFPPPQLDIIDNICPSDIGSFNFITGCPAGYHPEYSTDGGNLWSDILPLYNPLLSVLTRCVSDTYNECTILSTSPAVAQTNACCTPCELSTPLSVFGNGNSNMLMVGSEIYTMGDDGLSQTYLFGSTQKFETTYSLHNTTDLSQVAIRDILDFGGGDRMYMELKYLTVPGSYSVDLYNEDNGVIINQISLGQLALPIDSQIKITLGLTEISVGSYSLVYIISDISGSTLMSGEQLFTNGNDVYLIDHFIYTNSLSKGSDGSINGTATKLIDSVTGNYPSYCNCPVSICNLSVDMTGTPPTATCESGNAGKYVLTVHVLYSNLPGTDIVINGVNVTTNGTGDEVFTISGLNADGIVHDITVSAVGNSGCSDTELNAYTAPAVGSCSGVVNPCITPSCTPPIYHICSDGSDNEVLSVGSGYSNILWYNSAGVSVSSVNGVLTVDTSTTGMGDGSECFYPEASDASACDAVGCCPVIIESISCCPLPNCFEIIVTPSN